MKSFLSFHFYLKLLAKAELFLSRTILIYYFNTLFNAQYFPIGLSFHQELQGRMDQYESFRG